MNDANEVNRRTFLKTGSLAGAIVAAGQLSWMQQLVAAGMADAAAPSPRTPSWIDQPMRWAQLTLVEDDPGKFDPQFWLDYFKRTQSDAVCLSARRLRRLLSDRSPVSSSQRLAGRSRSVFGDLVTGCRKLGMVVIARTDPHATYDDVHDAHPDWIAVDAGGKPRRHWASPEMWVTCGLGPYNFEFMTEVKKEIMSRYRVDGIFINRWDGSGMCYCEHCRKNFQEAQRVRSAAHRAIRRIPRGAPTFSGGSSGCSICGSSGTREVRKINPDSCVIPNTGGGATSSLDMKTHWRTGANADGRPPGAAGPHAALDQRQEWKRISAPPWAANRSSGIFSVGVEEPYRWKDSACRAKPRFASGWPTASPTACGRGSRSSPGVLHDERWLKPVEEILPPLRAAGKNICAMSGRSRASAWFIRSRRRWFHGEQGRRSHAGLVSGA